MYDNGQGRPVERPYSRVVEFRVDLDARVATRLWEWRDDGWYDPVLGDADWLPNGNVLVTKGFNVGRTPEIDDVSQVVELRPPDEVVWRLSWTDRDWPTSGPSGTRGARCSGTPGTVRRSRRGSRR